MAWVGRSPTLSQAHPSFVQQHQHDIGLGRNLHHTPCLLRRSHLSLLLHTTWRTTAPLLLKGLVRTIAQRAQSPCHHPDHHSWTAPITFHQHQLEVIAPARRPMILNTHTEIPLSRCCHSDPVLKKRLQRRRQSPPHQRHAVPALHSNPHRQAHIHLLRRVLPERQHFLMWAMQSLLEVLQGQGQ